MKRLRMLLPILMILLLAGCAGEPQGTTPSAPPITQPTQPTQPTEEVPTVTAEEHFASTMYCTTIRVDDGTLGQTFPAELDMNITRYSNGEDAMALNMVMPEGSAYDFQDSKNTFSLQKVEPALPYDYAVAKIYQPLIDAYTSFDFLVDMEKGYMLYMVRAIPYASSYTVAATDPSADPFEILTHFSQFLQQPDIADRCPIPVPTEQYFHFDLSGTWFSPDAQPLSTMDFSLTTNLPLSFADGNELKPELVFRWPQDFGYVSNGAINRNVTVRISEENPASPQLYGNGLLYSEERDELVSYCFNIFPEDEIVILYMDGQYLVADTQGGDHAAILSRFEAQLYTEVLETVNWKLTVYDVTINGIGTESVPLTIQGSIACQKSTEILNLDIAFPSDYRYRYYIPEPYGDHAFIGMSDDPSDHVWSSFIFDKRLNDFSVCNIALNTEKGYFLLYLREENRYLVGCTDPSVEPATVIAHFREYLDKYCSN